MEPSNRTRRSWRFWGENPGASQDVNVQDALIEPENPRIVQDAQLDPAGACLLPACFEPDPEGAPLHSSPQRPPDACFEPDPMGAPLHSSPQRPPDACFEPDPMGAPLHSSPQRPPDACFEPDPIGAPPLSAIVLHPPPIVLHPPPVFVDHSRFKLLSLLDCDEDMPSASDSSGGHGDDNNDGRNSGEGAVVQQHRFKLLPLLDDDEDLPPSSDSSGGPNGDVDSDEDEDEECSIGNPFLTDSFGNQTAWRLSDLNAEFTKYLEEEASKPKEKKFTKEERLKVYSNRMERYMKSALQKYNGEEKLPEDMYFEFDKVQSQNWIVEGDYDNQYYYHFNFSATQAGSRTCLFFAEVIPDDGDSCDITCCKILNADDNGHCYGCKNAHVDDLRHPACLNVYVGGHVDRKFPFLIDTESEDDSEDDSV